MNVMELQARIKPSDFDITNQMGGSGLKRPRREREMMATNIVSMLLRRGDDWSVFTWEDYQEWSNHEVVSPDEQIVLNWLVADGLLRLDGSYYIICRTFFTALRQFIHPDKRLFIKIVQSIAVPTSTV